jgi:NAD(P)H-flavin reductase
MFTTKHSTQYKSATDPWIPFIYRVIEAEYENPNITTLVLEPEGHDAIEDLRPGQFSMLYAFGVGEIPISVSSILRKSPQITHTIQNVGEVSKTICHAKEGDIFGVRGPFGPPWPTEMAKGKDIIIMAGGLGIAPLRPLIEQILQERGEYNHVNVLYGTRNTKTILFYTDIISWQADRHVNFQITVDYAYQNWRGHVGVVTSLVDKAQYDPKNTVAFVCGPEVMMRFSVQALREKGIPEDSIYLSMERNMKCGFGHCGHCQYGRYFVCKDGPVFQYPDIKRYLKIKEI